MEQFLERFKSMSLFGKILLGLPFLILLILKVVGELSGMVDKHDRTKADDASSVIDKQKQETDNAIAVDEGKLQQLEADKQNAVEGVKNEDQSNFINNRFNPPKQ